MKMSPVLFTELAAAIDATIILAPGATMRERWNALFASGFPVNRLYDSGLNDNHIDTALRAIANR